MKNKMYRIVEEIEKDALGNTKSIFYIQIKTWLRWKKHSLPFISAYGNSSKYTVREKYPVSGSISLIEKLLEDIKKEESSINYKGKNLKKVYDYDWKSWWVDIYDYNLSPWGDKLYWIWSLEKLKEHIDKNIKTKTTRIV